MVYVTAGNVLNIVNTGKTVIETETRCTTSRKMPSLTQAPSRTDTTLSNIWKVMTQPRQHIKKQRHYFTNKVCLVKAMVFPVVMYGCESWTIKKAECRRIDAFELWCWRRLLRVPWTARRSNQSILKEISPECSLEGLMLKLKLQYFGHLMRRSDSFEKTLMLGKIEGRRRGQQRMMLGWHHGLNGHEFEQVLGDGEGQGSLACCSPWCCNESDTTE